MPLFDIFQKTEDEEHEQEKPRIKIIVDNREKNSLVISELYSQKDIFLEFKQLPVADFLIRDIAIERKTVSDFLSSMISKRLSRQLEEMKQYPKQLLVIEGIDERSLYSDERGINPNAIRGFLLNIVLEYQVPIIFTKNYEDTASFLVVLARKEKADHISLRAKKKSLNKKEQMQYILEGFPGIGPATAKKLLKHFKSIRNIINAQEEELTKLIGKKADIFLLTNKDY
jgi:ERCC4-type nuclease